MTKKYRLKQSVKEALIALAVFMAMFLTFWRVVLFGYPSDLESVIVISIAAAMLIGLIIKGGFE